MATSAVKVLALLQAALLALVAQAGLASAAPASPDQELARLLQDARASLPQACADPTADLLLRILCAGEIRVGVRTNYPLFATSEGPSAPAMTSTWRRRSPRAWASGRCGCPSGRRRASRRWRRARPTLSSPPWATIRSVTPRRGSSGRTTTGPRRSSSGHATPWSATGTTCPGVPSASPSATTPTLSSSRAARDCCCSTMPAGCRAAWRTRPASSRRRTTASSRPISANRRSRRASSGNSASIRSPGAWRCPRRTASVSPRRWS